MVVFAFVMQLEEESDGLYPVLDLHLCRCGG